MSQSQPLTTAMLLEALERAEEIKRDPRRFAGYQGRELAFVVEVLGVPVWDEGRPTVPGLTPKQVEIFLAAFQYRRLAVRSGHGIGKTFVLALIVLTWLYVWQGLVYTTASTWDQVEKVLWREIRQSHRRSRVNLPGEMLEVAPELRVTDDWFAVGLSVNQPTSFQGRHDPNLLVVIDEAPGVEDPIHEAIRSLATGEHNHVVMIGNPTETSGTFYNAFREGSWHRIHASCLDHPNVVLGREVIPGAVTRQWVEDYRADYGEHSPVFQSRVLGQFPESAENSVIPLAWVERAMKDDVLRLQKAETAKRLGEGTILSLDVSRYGGDRCVMVERVGDSVLTIDAWSRTDTMATVGRVVQKWRSTRARRVVVDVVGMGGSVVDRLIEVGVPVVPYHSGMPAANKSLFDFTRSEHWWLIRQRLEEGRLLLPQDQHLLADLTAPTYKFTSAGKIHVESKDDLKKRGVRSPDYADALIMAFAVDETVALSPEVAAAGQDPAALQPLPVQPQHPERIEHGAFEQFGWGY